MRSSDSAAPLWSGLVAAAEGSSGRTERSERLEPPAWILPDGTKPALRPIDAAANSPAGCPLPVDWEELAYVAVDCETTGLYADTDRIIELGAVMFRFDPEGALRIEREWSTLINPARSIPDAATAVHGITDLEVSAAPAFADIADSFSTLISGRVIVAHNAAFDLGFIDAEYARAGRWREKCSLADSLALARLAFPCFMSFNLGKLAFRLDIDTGSSHRALDDARTCMHIFVRAARSLTGTCP